MKNPTTLFDCSSKLDAFYLKNIIQQITYVPVKITRMKEHIYLVVEASNYPKVKVILDNQEKFLPSFMSSRAIEKENTNQEEQLMNYYWFTFINKLNHRVEVFTEQMASYNLHLIN